MWYTWSIWPSIYPSLPANSPGDKCPWGTCLSKRTSRKQTFVLFFSVTDAQSLTKLYAEQSDLAQSRQIVWLFCKKEKYLFIFWFGIGCKKALGGRFSIRESGIRPSIIWSLRHSIGLIGKEVEKIGTNKSDTKRANIDHRRRRIRIKQLTKRAPIVHSSGQKSADKKRQRSKEIATKRAQKSSVYSPKSAGSGNIGDLLLCNVTKNLTEKGVVQLKLINKSL